MFRKLLIVFLVISTSLSFAAQRCNNGGTIYYWDKFMLINNLWNIEDTGNGSWGCVYKYSGDDSGTEWNMVDVLNQSVKTYQGVYYGWSWKGWSGDDVELPVKVGDNKDIYMGWHYNISGASGKFNAAWDIWYHGNDQQSGDPTHEVMIWTHFSSMGPAGTKVDEVWLNGKKWHVYKKDNHNGWKLITFRIDNPDWTVSINLKNFNDYMQGKGWLGDNKYISGINMGTEAVEGKGFLYTSKYYVDVQ